MTDPRDKTIRALLYALAWVCSVVMILGMALVVSCTAHAQEAPQVARKIMHPLDACLEALRDSQQYDDLRRPFLWYVYVADGNPETRRYVNMALNAGMFNSAEIIRGVDVAGGYVVRVDLLAAEVDPKVRELFFGDPMFSVPFGGEVKKVITVTPYQASDGKTYTTKIVVDKLYFNAAVLPHAQALADRLGSNVPIVEARYLVARLLSTVDLGLGGGLYYALAGVPKGADKQTDEEAFFALFDISLKRSRDRLLVARAAVKQSGVTGKLRAIEVSQGAAHPATGDGVVYATFDLFDEDRGADRNPFRNLLSFIDDRKFRASEVIGSRRNGMQLYALFDDKGARQDSVPDKVAPWHSVPDPHTKRLIPGMACIQCHGTKEELGLKTFRNEVRDDPPLLDFTDKDSRRRLRSEYFAGNLDTTLIGSRNRYADAVFLATEGLTVDAASQGVFGLWSDYLYVPVDAVRACRDCGLSVESEQQALAALQTVTTRDPFIRALQRSDKIGRTQMAEVQADLMTALRDVAPMENPL